MSAMGRKQANSSGKSFKEEIAQRIQRFLEQRGLQGYEVALEYRSPIGSALRGRDRRVDVAILKDGEPILFVECKWQSTSGSAEDKLFRAQEEVRRDRLFGFHSVVVLGGSGWNKDLERWAIGEGMIREEWLEEWLSRFFR